jgi:DGQHR domain-containing protein
MKIIKIENQPYVYLLCQKIEQPIGSLYSTALDWKILKHISFSDPRVLIGYDDDGSEIYRGIQRALSRTRVEEIQKYVNEYDYATFPTSVLINFPHEKVEIVELNIDMKFDSKKASEDFNLNPKTIERSVKEYPNLVMLIFPYEKSIAQIIDGQHRMSGFKDTDNIKFDLPVTIFVDQLVEQQAEIFSTINGKQTRVTPSLVYELFGITERKSPYKTAHNIIKVLNESDESPIKNWIKRLGKSNNYYDGYITQSTANKNILKLLSGNAKQVDEDMRSLARGDELSVDTPYSRNGGVLRKFFIKNDEISIIKILFNFFNAIEEKFPDEWEKENSIFKRTIGITALFKVLTDLIPVGLNQKSLKKEFFLEMIREVELNPNVTLSSKGINEIYEQFNSSYSKKIS